MSDSYNEDLELSFRTEAERLLRACDDYDVIVECRDREWHLHKEVLAHASTYFRACFSGAFQESNNNLVGLRDVDVGAFNAIVRWIYAPDKVELFKHQQREGSRNDDPLKDLSINCFFSVLLLADRLMMKNLIYDMCERLVDEFETSLSRCAGRRQVTAAEEAEAQAWARDGKVADANEVMNEGEEGVDGGEEADEDEQVDEEEGAKESLRIREHLEQMSHLPDHLRHKCENGVIRAVLQSIKKGFSAEMIELEPLQTYVGTHSDFAIGLCRCMASRLEEMEAFWDYQLESDNKQKQTYLGMHGSEEEELSFSPSTNIAS